MTAEGKITDILRTLDEFSKKPDPETAKGELISSSGTRRRHREASLLNPGTSAVLHRPAEHPSGRHVLYKILTLKSAIGKNKPRHCVKFMLKQGRVILL